MIPEVEVAIITFCGTLIGTLGGIIASAKMTAYRIEQLEKKVEKHNQLIERTFKLEGRMTEAEHDIKEIKGVIK